MTHLDTKKQIGKKMLPLENIKILDLTRLIPGGVATSILADLGAEVIKVEEPKFGDYGRGTKPLKKDISWRFLLLNRNKKSIALNLKQKEGYDIFIKLVKDADVVIEGFRPGVTNKLKIDYENLSKINDKIIYCSITSYGQNGPFRDVIAHDLNILAESGFFHTTGIEDGPPIIPGIQIADITAGLNAAIGILVSLIFREKTGKGQYVDISMFDGVFCLLFDALSYAFAGEKIPERGKGRLYGGLSNYQIYETKDKKFIAVGALETKFKNILLDHLGLNSFIEKDDNSVTTQEVSDREKELKGKLQEKFLEKTSSEWREIFEKLNICVNIVNDIEEAIRHPQTKFRELVVKSIHPKLGEIFLTGFPIKFSQFKVKVDRIPVPKLGEHTYKILKELGYDEEKIEELSNKGVIKIHKE